MYQALYRKWRPQTFADVIGQQHITDTLRAQLQSGRLSQHICLQARAAPARPPVRRSSRAQSTASIR